MNLLVDALAVYRLTRLLVEDRITDKPREAVEDWAAREGFPMLRYFVGCPWCVSIYVAGGVVAARRLAPRAWGPVAELLAMSAVTGILSEQP